MENELNEEILKPKLSIIEPDFILDICDWNPTTLAFLKAFTDRKCNSNKKIDPPVESNDKPLIEPITDTKPETKPDTQFIPDPKETEDNIPTEKEKQDFSTPPEKKLKICQYKVKEEEILGTDGNMKIYRQVKEYLEKHLPDNFTRLDMINMLPTAWKKIFNEELSLGSAKTYWAKYKRYMVNQGLIKEDESYHYHKVKEDETVPDGKDDDDDSDGGKDHCYLPDWTNDELDFLEKNIFKFPKIDKAIEFIAKELGKTEDEVRSKAKKRGMILR